ncbi:hypothetical protein BJ165DRAFT_325892 [Panaeolus papilionaceus]|nr:hypothetical protein BJ165DRAFT_325892 [Panaeolus papilionaceus]
MTGEDELLSAASGFHSRNYSSLAALVLVVFDYLSTLIFEYRSIWVPPARAVKLLYLCSRYLGLTSQIAHYTLIHTHLAKAPVSPTTCRVWITSLISSSVCLLLVLDGILFLRIYALYQQRKRMLWVLIPIATQPIAIAISTQRSLFKEGDLDELCDYKGSVLDAVILSFIVLSVHMILWVVTFVRRNIAQGQAVVVKLVVQESAWALALFFAMLVAIAPYSSMKRRISPFFILSWTIGLQSILVSRCVVFCSHVIRELNVNYLY